MQKSVNMLATFKGITDEDLERAHRPMLTLLRLLVVLLIVPIGYRNLVAEPTSYGWPLTIVVLAVGLVTLPQPLSNVRWRLTVASILMLCGALLVQLRNPGWPAVGFMTAVPALLIALAVRGFLFSLLCMAAYTAATVVILLVLVQLPLVAFAAVIVAFLGLSALPIILFTVLLESRQRYWGALQSAQSQLERQIAERDQIFQALSAELSAPLEALRRMPMAREKAEVMAAEMAEVGGEVAAIVEDLKQNLIPEDQMIILRPVDCNVPSLIDSLRRQLQPTLAAQGIALEVDIGHLPSSYYRIDTPKLRAVLSNLMRRDFFHRGASQLILSCNGQREDDGIHLLRFTIRSDGAGLPPRDEVKLFKNGVCRPFSEQPGLRSESYDSSGLHRSADVLAQMAGRLGYGFSTDGRPCYEVLIKVPPSSLEGRSDEHGDWLLQKPLKGFRTAIVDDDFIIARMCQRILLAAGCDAVDIYRLRDVAETRLLSGKKLDLIFFDSTSLVIKPELLLRRIAHEVGPVHVIAMHPLPNSVELQPLMSTAGQQGGLTAATERPLVPEKLVQTLRRSGIIDVDNDMAVRLSYQ